MTFTLRRALSQCPPVKLNDSQIPHGEDAKYLGVHLDRRLTWRRHIFTKRKQLGLQLRQMYGIVGRGSQLSAESKVLLYKVMLKLVWTHGMYLWGTDSN